MKKPIALCLLVSVLAGACASVPSGPSVMVLPGSGKDFGQFQVEDADCRQFASQQVGTSVNEAGAKNTATGAVIGTVVGAALGAAIGAAAGSPATGAAVGAGAGLFGGTAVGASNAQASQYSVQRRYDASYVQCMYARGNQVPVARGSMPAYHQPAAAAPPPPPPPPPANTPSYVIPPPPAGTPPPPPPPPTR